MYDQERLNTDPEQSCYRTGFTEPKKPKRGIAAAVLIAVIFLSGIHTAFRLLDIRMFREITKDSGVAPASVRFSAGKDRTPAEDLHVPALGISGESISNFEHLYYDVPAGFYITEVASGSLASVAGIQPGDVLLYFNGHHTPNLESLKEKLAGCTPGEPVCLLLHRRDTTFSVEIYLAP